MPKAGFKPTITASNGSKTVHVSDRSATVTSGNYLEQGKTTEVRWVHVLAMFNHQFEAVAGYNSWAPGEKATHLVTVLQGQAANALQSHFCRSNIDEIIKALEGCYADHQLAMVYHCQLKARTQKPVKSMQVCHCDGIIIPSWMARGCQTRPSARP
jgi:hypothetical protein